MSTDDLLERAATLLFIDGKWYARGRWSAGMQTTFSPPCRTAREALLHLVDKGGGGDKAGGCEAGGCEAGGCEAGSELNSDLF